MFPPFLDKRMLVQAAMDDKKIFIQTLALTRKILLLKNTTKCTASRALKLIFLLLLSLPGASSVKLEENPYIHICRIKMRRGKVKERVSS